MSGPDLAERALQPQILRFFLFELLQGAAGRTDDIGEYFPDVLELTDTALGLGQQIAQGFIVLAQSGSDFTICVRCFLQWDVIWSGIGASIVGCCFLCV
jgi:hypothetical protein